MTTDSEIDAQINEIFTVIGDRSQVLEKFKNMEPFAIARAMVHLASTGATGADMDAIRDAGTAIVHVKLTDKLISTMEKLDTAATRLYRIGIILSAIIGIAGICIPIYLNR